MHLRILATTSLTLALLAPAMPAAALTTLSFTGTLSANDPNRIGLFPFAVVGDQTVTLRSFGYAGGTNAEDTLIVAGGFDPVITLFDQAGAFITEFDDGSDVVDPLTGRSDDALGFIDLAAGTYYAAISAYANLAEGTLPFGFVGGGSFVDISGAARSNAYAFDLTITPLPAALPLLAGALGGLALATRRRRG